jgi:hypothetical protein
MSLLGDDGMSEGIDTDVAEKDEGRDVPEEFPDSVDVEVVLVVRNKIPER